VVLLAKLLLDPWITEQSPFLLLAGAVAVAAWFGGLGPGLLATALGAVGADYFFLPPSGAFTGLGLHSLPLILFVLQGILISSLVEALRSAKERAEESKLEAQRHEGELRRSEHRFRVLVQNSSDVITVIDDAGIIRYVSPAVERLMGYHPEELVGKTVSYYVDAEDVEGARNLFAELWSRPGVNPPFEFKVSHKDGTWRHSEFLVNNLLDDPNVRGVVVNQRDITERKEAEKKLRENEELYRSVVEQAAENIFLVDVETKRIIQGNDALHDSLGYSTDELRRLTLYDIVAHDHENIERNVRLLLEEGHRYIGERKYRRKDGSLIDVEVNASAISYGGRDVMCVVAHDVTERKRSEEALRRSLDALLALYETGQLLGSSLEREEIGSNLLGIIERIAGATGAVIYLGEDREYLHPWRTIGPESVLASVRDKPEARAARRAVFEAKEERMLEMESLHLQEERLTGLFLPLRVRDGSIGVLEVYGPKHLAESGAVETFASLANQAASALENARLYEELAEHRRRLQDLVGKLVTAQEHERRRVAYEVHDGLAQVAAAAYQHLQNFAADNPPATARAQEELDLALEMLQQTVGEARNVVADLRPTVLDDFGLSTALRLQVERLSEEGLRASYEETLGGERLPEAVETALFRVAQEALTNVRKHARADRVHVALERRGQALRLQVRDWGRGFVPDGVTGGADPGEKVGLSSMRERIALLRGRFEIHSEPGAGTVVEAEVPLQDAIDTEEENDDKG
jgi:PAS domain S-box-containing protein